MAIQNTLTTLSNVKSWLGISSANDDVLLNKLVEEVSRFILNYLERPTLFKYVFSDVYDGNGGNVIFLRNTPVQSVAMIMINDTILPATTTQTGVGFYLEPWNGLPPARSQAIVLRGYEFTQGYSNVNIVYTAGFMISNESAAVPASAAYTVTAASPHGSFAVDHGVTYANGNVLTRVTNPAAAGQYSVAETTGVYSFHAGDANANIRLTYSYVPADVQHACMELVGERYRYKGRIGEISKNIGGEESITFSQKDIPDFIRTLLQPYKNIRV